MKKITVQSCTVLTNIHQYAIWAWHDIHKEESAEKNNVNNASSRNLIANITKYQIQMSTNTLCSPVYFSGIPEKHNKKNFQDFHDSQGPFTGVLRDLFRLFSGLQNP